MAVCEEAPLPADRLAQARRELQALAGEAASLDPPARIEWVNAAINRRLDDMPGAAADCAPARWHLPEEALARGAGNCSDFAIAKFFLLLAGGTPPAALRLLYAMRRPPATPGLRVPHLVTLARDPFVDPLVLDAINPLAIPLSSRDDLEPVFSFDRRRVWAGADGPDQGSAPERLRPWRELLARIQS